MATILERYKLLEEYPETMSKDQFYRIANISKRTAKYLLDSGLVPCTDSGKKTRKYQIKTRDVVFYLCERKINPEKYKIPRGYFAGNKSKPKQSAKNNTEIVLFHFTEPEKTGLYIKWEELAADYNDLMTTDEVVEMTGYSAQSIYRWCRQKILVGFKINGKLLIPKLAIIEFMSSERATEIYFKSPRHLDLLRAYAEDCHEGAMTII